MSSRILSTPELLAASSSVTSKDMPLVIPMQELHLPQGLLVGKSPLVQLRDLAKIRALEVFPVPLEPVNKYAGAMRLVEIALVSVSEIAPCPTN